jgi:hypothetical protein
MKTVSSSETSASARLHGVTSQRTIILKQFVNQLSNFSSTGTQKCNAANTTGWTRREVLNILKFKF